MYIDLKIVIHCLKKNYQTKSLLLSTSWDQSCVFNSFISWDIMLMPSTKLHQDQ